ncbi:MAG: hypothetical protein V7638_134 [Acidobacteriota bacterium]|jgi:hypothetical protein
MNINHKDHQMTLLNSKMWIALSLAGVAIAFGLLIGTRRNSIEAASTWQQSDAALGPQAPYRETTEELSLTLSAKGFSPAELTAAGKRFLLSVDNRTDLKEVVLRLSDKHGNQVREIRVPGGPGDWSELFDLKSGKYVLSEANHSQWSCSIVVP